MSTADTNAAIERLTTALAGATPGEWRVRNVDDEMFMSAWYVGIDYETDLGEESEKVIAITLLQAPRYADNPLWEENANFIAAAHNDLPALLAEVGRLQEFIDLLEDHMHTDEFERLHRTWKAQTGQDTE